MLRIPVYNIGIMLGLLAPLAVSCTAPPSEDSLAIRVVTVSVEGNLTHYALEVADEEWNAGVIESEDERRIMLLPTDSGTPGAEIVERGDTVLVRELPPAGDNGGPTDLASIDELDPAAATIARAALDGELYAETTMRLASPFFRGTFGPGGSVNPGDPIDPIEACLDSCFLEDHNRLQACGDLGGWSGYLCEFMSAASLQMCVDDCILTFPDPEDPVAPV